MQSIASNGSPLNQWFRQQGSTKTRVLPNPNKDKGHKHINYIKEMKEIKLIREIIHKKIKWPRINNMHN